MRASWCILVAALGCGTSRPGPEPMAEEKPPPGPAVPPVGSSDAVAVLGKGSHRPDARKLAVVAGAADGLSAPRDLAFHATRPGEAWIVDQASESITVLFHAGDAAQTAKTFHGDKSAHFLARPIGIAAGGNGNFATIHETDQATQPTTPWDFMGPTLWTSDFAYFDAGEKGHIDMLHDTPNGMGIAWDHDNVYWVFDGEHGAITRYDFQKDHGPGGEDHSDGIVARFVEGEVARVPGVASHLELGPDRRTLFIADTGHARVAVLDTQSGTRAGDIQPNYDGSQQYRMTGATLATLVDGAAHGIAQPSGLAIRGGALFVGDHASGIIHAFTLEGAELDWLDTGLGPGALSGIELDAGGSLYFVDTPGNRVWRLAND